MKKNERPLLLVLAFLLCVSGCSGREKAVKDEGPAPSSTENGLDEGAAEAPQELPPAEDKFNDFLRKALEEAGIPQDMARYIMTSSVEGPAFIMDLLACLEGDPFLRRLVDKKHALPDAYRPDDLVELKAGSYAVNRRGLTLRAEAEAALEEMAAAARREGISILVSSAFRSYEYQVEVYNRIVQEMGQEEADRESARPGYSQHQSGLAADFGSIDDSFAETAAGRWIAVNGSRFGWSLSFPNGYEELTGYRWESWHFRYVGRDLAAFIETWFGGIQQYALQFIHTWEMLSTP